MLIRTATIEDLQQIAEVEAACFPPAEAATEDENAAASADAADETASQEVSGSCLTVTDS